MKPESDHKIRIGQIALLYQNAQFALFATFAVAVILSVVLWNQISHSLIISWLSALLILTSYRSVVTWRYHHATVTDNDHEHWRRLFVSGVFLSGCLWGAAGIFLYPEHSFEHQYLVVLTIAGLCGGAIASLSAQRCGYALFALPALLPFAIQEFAADTHIGRLMGSLILLFLFLTMGMARRAHDFVNQSIAIRYENTSLLGELRNRYEELQEKNEALHHANTLLDNVFRNTDVLYAYLDTDFRFIRVNRAYAEADGHPPEYYLGKNHFELYPNEENERIFREVVTSGQPFTSYAKAFEYHDHPEIGTTYWNWSLQPIRDRKNQIEGLLLTLIDVTEQNRAKMAAQEKEIYLATIMKTAVDGILTTDDQGIIESVNDAILDEFGYTRDELIGKDIGVLMPDYFRAQHAEFMRQYNNRDDSRMIGRTVESMGQRKDGSSFALEISVSDALINGRRVFAGMIRNITRQVNALRELENARRELEHANLELQKRNAELNHLSTHDPLTGIANRRSFNQTILEEWNRAKRSHHELSVILVDIDYFKRFNDHYGHQAGDNCLRKITSLMSAIPKRPGDMLARYGGEEFIAILPETDSAGACEIAEKMIEAIRKAAIPHAKSNIEKIVTISAGVSTTIPDEDDRPEHLIAEADSALYQAKQHGRNRVVCSSLTESESRPLAN